VFSKSLFGLLSFFFDYQCLSPLQLWVKNMFTARYTRYNIMWSSLSVTCDRSVVFLGYSGFLHLYCWTPCNLNHFYCIVFLSFYFLNLTHLNGILQLIKVYRKSYTYLTCNQQESLEYTECDALTPEAICLLYLQENRC